uniref:Ig-like domain-containing protein n=1 Tax=Dromaius novaehollandiae TaxID=8790 RepID=A0A8C4KV18_DRONO
MPCGGVMERGDLFSPYPLRLLSTLSLFLFIEPPTFVRELRPTEVVKGMEATLECEVTGTPPFEVKWLKNNKEMFSSKKYAISTKESVFTLNVTNCDVSDVGEYQYTANYTCNVSNVAGSDSCSAVLTMLGKDPKSSANITVLHLLILTLKSYCLHFLIVSLYPLKFTVSLLPSVTHFSSFLGISVVTEYFFPLKNTEPPSFLVKPESQQVIPDSTVEFKTTLKGTPPFTVKWFKEDLELVSGPTCFIGIEGSTGFLTLYSVDTSRSGHYTCHISNDVGSDSCTTTLMVTEPPKFAKKLEAAKVVKQGDSARLECKVSGSPEMKVVWFRNDHEIVASEKFRTSFIDSVAVLEMNHLSTEESGDYICEAHNPAGKASCSTKVTVKEPPVFSRKPSPVDMLKGTEVSLECEISGTPPFDVTWYKDRRQIRSSKKYKVTAKNYHTSVHILNVEAADVGEYQCKAQNDVGSDTCFCIVKLKEPPKFLTKINSVTVVVGEPVELQARVEGSQPISVQWLKDKEEVIRESENTRITFVENIATLQLTSTETSSAGKYICQIRNDAGSRECMATLTVLGW